MKSFITVMTDFCCCQNDVRLVMLHSVHDLAGWGWCSGALSSMFTWEAVFPDTVISGWSGQQEDDTVMECPEQQPGFPQSALSPQFTELMKQPHTQNGKNGSEC